MGYRIGNGIDAHRFKSGRSLILGGVSIPFDRGLEAHSDGDVLIHAVCDALLGAMALGDIGQHFPDNDQAYKGVDSRVLLRKIVDMMVEKGYQLENADITVIAQAPKLAGYIPSMREILCQDLRVEMNRISIKATTTERMGFTGREEGIASMCSVLLSD